MKSIQDIPVLKKFEDVSLAELFEPVPDEWSLFLTDVVNSTKAIESGKYKDINVIGAASIIAVLNVVGKSEVAFIFGGDGAALLVPPQWNARVAEVLLNCQSFAKEKMGFELRVGAVPVSAVRLNGADLRVARLSDRGQSFQTVFAGSGLQEAERLVKVAGNENKFLVKGNGNANAVDFRGLECRWKPVRSRRGEMCTVIVRARTGTGVIDGVIYSRVIETIETIYGKESPVSFGGLKISARFKDYRAEARVRQNGSRIYQFFAWVLTNLFVRAWQFFGSAFWKKYRSTLVRETDFRKFDGSLQMVQDGEPVQHDALERELKKLFEQKALVYGMHRSKTALLTCLVFDREHDSHVHFLDGAAGGYAEAARQLKAQLGA